MLNDRLTFFFLRYNYKKKIKNLWKKSEVVDKNDLLMKKKKLKDLKMKKKNFFFTI